MKTRHKRIALIVGGLAILGAVVALVLNAFQSNLVFFFSPTQVAAGEAPKGKPFRIGGMVKEGSIQREADGVTLRFVVTDTEKEMDVLYKGILPDLFKEGKGAVAQGRIGDEAVNTEKGRSSHGKGSVKLAARWKSGWAATCANAQ